MSGINSNDLSTEVIDNIITESAFSTEIDEDGDIYVTGSQISFPCWVSLLSELNAVCIFTYINFKKTVTKLDALNFINNANMNVVLPCFYIIDTESDDGIKMYSNYIIDVENSLESKFLIKSLIRFASAFSYSLTLDEDSSLFE